MTLAGPGSSAVQLRAAVLGHPITHSRSPLLHSAAYRALGVDIDYTAIDTLPGQAQEIASRLRTEPGWVGVSVTMPMKDALIPHLDGLSERVQRLGALNTVVVRHDGGAVRLHGHNTDVDGIVGAMGGRLPTRGPADGPDTGRRAAILGAGNTALAALEALALLGYTHVDLVVRNPQRATAALDLAHTLALACTAIDLGEAGVRLGGYEALISTLPAHAADAMAGPLGLAPGALAPGALLLDVAYDPWPSVLATVWEEAGGTVVSGLWMLLHQGVEQVKLFSGVQHADWERVTNVMCDAVGLSRP